MTRIGRSFVSTFRAVDGQIIPSNYLFGLRHNRIPQTSSQWKNSRWSGFLFHVSNLHRSQHQLAHQDDKGGGSATTTTTDTDEGLKVKKQKSTKKVIEKKKTTFMNFFYERWLRFLDSYMGFIEKKFPGAMQVYRVFVIGFKDFVVETKDFVILKKRVMFNSMQIRDMSKNEVEMYYRMPGEMWRVGPVLLISALPFANYVVFPIAYCFPKTLLSSHFWTLQQKSQFAIEFQTDKVANYRPVFRHLQLNLEDIKDAKLRKSAQLVLNQLGSGSHPSVPEIMAIKPLFEYDRYSLKAMHGPHVKALCRAHGLSTLCFKRGRLADRAEMLHNMDTVLLREGLFGVKTDELKNACYVRGLNGANASRKDMMEFMQQWMAISTSINWHAYSLLLHLPILLAYNHPNNWFLMKA